MTEPDEKDKEDKKNNKKKTTFDDVAVGDRIECFTLKRIDE